MPTAAPAARRQRTRFRRCPSVHICSAVLGLAALSRAAIAGEAPNWWEVSSEENAKSLALYFDREARRHFVYTEGNIASSEKALSMYFNVARGPTVKNICA